MEWEHIYHNGPCKCLYFVVKLVGSRGWRDANPEHHLGEGGGPDAAEIFFWKDLLKGNFERNFANGAFSCHCG